MSLHQIMYISSATGPVSATQCAAIAKDAEDRNRVDGVTGLLLFNSKRFLQVLEGPKDAVERIYQRVARDGRHNAIVKLRDMPIEAREFGEWGMAYDDPFQPASALKDKVAKLLDHAGPSTRAHFIGAAEMHRG